MAAVSNPILGLFVAVAAVGLACGVRAAAAPAEVPALRAMLDCRALTDGVERLACFDRTAAVIDKAEHAGDLVTIDKAQRRALRRESFGFTLPSMSLFDRGEKAEDSDRLTGTLASAFRAANGRWVLKLDDGAVWRQIDDDELLKEPKPGSKAVIRKGALGAYLMNIDGQPSIKVHRDS